MFVHTHIHTYVCMYELTCVPQCVNSLPLLTAFHRRHCCPSLSCQKQLANKYFEFCLLSHCCSHANKKAFFCRYTRYIVFFVCNSTAKKFSSALYSKICVRYLLPNCRKLCRSYFHKKKKLNTNKAQIFGYAPIMCPQNMCFGANIRF